MKKLIGKNVQNKKFLDDLLEYSTVIFTIGAVIYGISPAFMGVFS
tara:strand:- start:1422 stop:1556 length:135 start_codon:yes stop_codon:yes gene_type:complete